MAKKGEKVVKKSNTKPHARILSISIEVLALFLPHACTRTSHSGLNLGLDSGCRPKTCSKFKSAHTALAVKACLLGGNSYTKCSITFVNIAVAISALAGGGGKNGFAPRPELGGVFDIFRGFLGV